MLFAYNNAVAVKDVGLARTGIGNFAAHTVNAVMTLENGEITSGCNSSRYFIDGLFYFEASGSETKIKLNSASEAVVFLYHNDLFTSLGFFSAFAPLSMARIAGVSDQYPIARSGDTITVVYTGTYSAIQPNWSAQGNPFIYFDAGKSFEFKLSDGRLTQVKQSGGSGRTIDFYYEDDILPEVSVPADKAAYVQKWQLQVAVIGGGTSILYKENLNKTELDEEIFGADYKPQTKNLTYYYDSDMNQPINFVDGIASLNGHIEIYHPGIDYDNATVARFDYSYGKIIFTKVSETTEGEIKTTTLRALEDMNGVRSFSISIQPRPTNTKNKTVKVTFAETPTGETYAEAIDLTEYEMYTSLSVVFPVSGEYLLKVETEAEDGSVYEYIRILPKES